MRNVNIMHRIARRFCMCMCAYLTLLSTFTKGSRVRNCSLLLTMGEGNFRGLTDSQSYMYCRNLLLNPVGWKIATTSVSAEFLHQHIATKLRLNLIWQNPQSDCCKQFLAFSSQAHHLAAPRTTRRLIIPHQQNRLDCPSIAPPKEKLLFHIKYTTISTALLSSSAANLIRVLSFFPFFYWPKSSQDNEISSHCLFQNWRVIALRWGRWSWF